MSIRLFLACCLCRVSRALLRLTGRGGTALPGRLALRIDPQVLSGCAAGVDTVLVTGTNGKTTTTALLCAMLRAQGRDFFTITSGANLRSGITAEFVANADLLGRAKKSLAVIECDEGALKQVAPALNPRLIVVTNVFRDQLDRYGEVTHTLGEIRRGIELSPRAILCLNADCSLTASLADTGRECVFFGVNAAGEAPAVSDAPRCLRCGAPYRYRRHSYAHLGDFFCPDCGYSRPEPDFLAEDVDCGAEESHALLRSEQATLPLDITLPGLHNVYNALAALTAAALLRLSLPEAAETLQSARSGFGRMEELTVDGVAVRIILVKNPAGCDGALRCLEALDTPFRAVFALNDNTADGTDVSWIWDADYEGFLERCAPETLAVCGSRAGELRLRLKYAGAEERSIRLLPDAGALRDLIGESRTPLYLLPNYTALLELREALAKAAGKGAFWE